MPIATNRTLSQLVLFIRILENGEFTGVFSWGSNLKNEAEVTSKLDNLLNQNSQKGLFVHLFQIPISWIRLSICHLF